MPHLPDPVIPGCPDKVLVTHPTNPNGEFNSLIEAADRIVALHGPGVDVSNYKFFISNVGIQGAAPSFSQWPNVVQAGWWNTMPQEDGHGNHLCYMSGFIFQVMASNLPQTAVNPAYNIGATLSSAVWSFTAFIPTFQQFLDEINNRVGYTLVTASQFGSMPNPVSSLCKQYSDWLTTNVNLNGAQFNTAPTFNLNGWGCQFGIRPCEPELVNNPCYNTAIFYGVSTNILAYAPFALGNSYVTGNFTSLPTNVAFTLQQTTNMASPWYLLITPNYTNANPFNMPTSTADAIDEIPNAIWVQCGGYSPPNMDLPQPCDCPVYEEYNSNNVITPTHQGFWYPDQTYQCGDTFHLDWYTDGLSILMSHPDANFVSFMGSQNLMNPISTFELPTYDYFNGQWFDDPSGIFATFQGTCNDEPGFSCYVWINCTQSSVDFESATLDDWLNGFVIPGVTTAPPLPTTPYWSVMSGNYPQINTAVPDIAWYANQGIALVNRNIGCCRVLKEGCMDITALNYSPSADYACPDTDNDGKPDCCTYPAPVPVAECLPKLTKEEFLMNVSQKPETRSDVFIERGKTSVFERTQRLAQTPTIGELELHGYGYYKINEQRF